MQTSDFKKHLNFFAMLLLSALLCLWLSQTSINRYWQQTYHRPSPLMSLNRFALWRLGGDLHQQADKFYQALRQRIQWIDQRIAAQQAPLVSEKSSDLHDSDWLDKGLLAEQTLAPPQADDLANIENDSGALPEAAREEKAEENSTFATANTEPEQSTDNSNEPPPAPHIEQEEKPALSVETALASETSTHETAGQAVEIEPSKTALSDSQSDAQNNVQHTEEPRPAVANHTQSEPLARKPLMIGARDLSNSGTKPQATALAMPEAPNPPPLSNQSAAQNAVNHSATAGLNPKEALQQELAESPPQHSVEPASRKPLQIGARDLTHSGTNRQTAQSTAENSNSEAVKPSAENDNAEAVKLTAENDHIEAVKLSAENGNSEVIKLSAENGNSEAAKLSAENGNTEAVKLSAENGSAEAAKSAAENGNTAVAKSAVENSNSTAVPAPKPTALPEKISLAAGDKVLLIGDSLMQGVAPYVQQALQQRYAISSLNLSKQSTGLSYPDFFDWPLTVEKTLAADSSIKAVVVFLGPNDPWDLPDPNKGEKSPYLKFKSKEWEAVYRSRISRIVQAADAQGAGVIWLGLPFMQPEPLNSQMQYLDGVMRSEVRGKAIFVPTKYILTGGAEQYTDSMLIDGKTVRLRSKDGIHFTPTGQKQIAIAVMRRLEAAPVKGS